MVVPTQYRARCNESWLRGLLLIIENILSVICHLYIIQVSYPDFFSVRDSGNATQDGIRRCLFEMGCDVRKVAVFGNHTTV